jgi:hypothetical protein
LAIAESEAQQSDPRKEAAGAGAPKIRLKRANLKISCCLLRLGLKIGAMAATKDPGNSPLDWWCRIWLVVAITITGSTLMNNKVAGQQVPEKTGQGLTCNLDGIPSQERARYTELFELLRRAIREKRELPEGFSILLDPQFTMDQALEWTKLEGYCCPFLEMQVRWDIENGPVWLDLKGPEGVKDFILDEFGLK